MNRIYTRTGDAGTTGIHGGSRVPKDDPRIEANGDLDELNCQIGVVRSMLRGPVEPGLTEMQWDEGLHRIQQNMMTVMSLVATPSAERAKIPNELPENLVADCEAAIERLERNGFHGQIFLYTMIGGKNDFAECYSRIAHWRHRAMDARNNHAGRCCTYPYAQPYRDPTNPHHVIPQWQKDMAQWCNKRQLFVAFDFPKFTPRKGFYCKEYFKT